MKIFENQWKCSLMAGQRGALLRHTSPKSFGICFATWTPKTMQTIENLLKSMEIL